MAYHPGLPHAESERKDTLQPSLRWAMLMGLIRFIESRDVWLSLYEPSEFKDNLLDLQLEPVTDAELLIYQRQLFYWLLVR